MNIGNERKEQCVASMQVARTTVQRIYEIARKKIADALIDGHPLRIEGGVSGDADKAVEAFINDTLDYYPDMKCSHHEHSHGEGHTCGEHGCGSHSCH